jgi:hypothetical protein
MGILTRIPWKTVIKYAGTAASAVMAVVGVISDQKHAMEFEQMKKDIENLKNSI